MKVRVKQSKGEHVEVGDIIEVSHPLYRKVLAVTRTTKTQAICEHKDGRVMQKFTRDPLEIRTIPQNHWDTRSFRVLEPVINNQEDVEEFERLTGIIGLWVPDKAQ